MGPIRKNESSSGLTAIERVILFSSLLGLLFGVLWALLSYGSVLGLFIKSITGFFCGQGLGCLLLELKKP